MEDKELNSYRNAGKIATMVREWSKSLIKEDAKILEIAERIEGKILESGGEIAFPVNICINDITAHYTPKYNDSRILTGKDLVSVDIGIHIDGFIADTAYTIDLSGNYGKLLEINEIALKTVISMIKPEISVREIGREVQRIIKNAGFKPIENLTGHEVKQYELHAGISIPSVEVPYNWIIKEDMVLAIEPFATNGYGRVVESKQAEIFSLEKIKPTRTQESRLILNEIKERRKLPFAERWFAKKINPMKLDLIFRELVSNKIIKAYPILHEKEKGVVSQFEHTVIVTRDGCEIITK